MEVISVKKLIVATLIFLFSSYNIPALAHDAPVTMYEQVVKEKMPIIKQGTPQIGSFEDVRYVSKQVISSFDIASLLSMPFEGAKLTYVMLEKRLMKR